MKIATLAILAIGIGALSVAGATANVGGSPDVVEAKKCTYGSYVASDGTRKCRKKPRGSF